MASHTKEGVGVKLLTFFKIHVLHAEKYNLFRCNVFIFQNNSSDNISESEKAITSANYIQCKYIYHSVNLLVVRILYNLVLKPISL